MSHARDSLLLTELLDRMNNVISVMLANDGIKGHTVYIANHFTPAFVSHDDMWPIQNQISERIRQSNLYLCNQIEIAWAIKSDFVTMTLHHLIPLNFIDCKVNTSFADRMHSLMVSNQLNYSRLSTQTANEKQLRIGNRVQLIYDELANRIQDRIQEAIECNHGNRVLYTCKALVYNDMKQELRIGSRFDDDFDTVFQEKFQEKLSALSDNLSHGATVRLELHYKLFKSGGFSIYFTINEKN
jgi:mRNA-degrading endonuclease RelE of RelBE toxin-antitoxin system